MRFFQLLFAVLPALGCIGVVAAGCAGRDPHTWNAPATAEGEGEGEGEGEPAASQGVPRARHPIPQGGDVLVAASMPATGSAVGAQLAVYIRGVPVFVAAHALTPGALWEAALVRWPNPADVEAGEVPCIAAIDDGAVGECVAFAE